MGFVSRPVALAVLSCCLVFGVLLGLTGLAKDSRPTEPSTATAGLRGVDEQETARRTMTTGGPVKQKVHEAQQGSLASAQWPELAAETGGLWGPDDEERLQLQLEDNKEVAADAQADFWGADLHEALLNANWDRLMDMDMDESFSFSYTM